MAVTWPIKVTLCVLVGVGLYQALNVSYTTWTGLKPCPSLMYVPVCYLVSIGYGLMFVSICSSVTTYNHPKPFYIGWGIVFVIACLGVGFELTIGDVCPKSSNNVPLCYISLVFSLLILSLFQWNKMWVART